MRFAPPTDAFMHVKTPRTVTLAVLASVLLLPLGAGAALGDDDILQPQSSSQCASGRFCLWSGTAYTGTFFSTTTSVDSGPGWTAKPVYNRTTRAVRVYSGTAGGGSSTCFAPGASSASVTVAAASIRVLSTTTC